MAGQSVQTSSTPAAVHIADEIYAIYRNIAGVLYVAPKVIRFVFSKESVDKKSDESYKKYMERLKGKEFSKTEWKRHGGTIAEDLSHPDDLDITALFCLLEKLSRIHDECWRSVEFADSENISEEGYLTTVTAIIGGGGQPANNEELPGGDAKCPLEKLSRLDKNGLPRDVDKLFDKLRKVRNLRVKIMHEFEETSNPRKFSDLKTALLELIEEAERVYSLPQSEVEAQKKNVHDDFESLQNPDEKTVYYWCTRLDMSGKLAVKNLWRTKLTEEILPLDSSIVQRPEVFHSLDVMVRRSRREGSNDQVLPYTEIFKAPEKAIIVSGVAGAGKTTLLKNIVLQFFELGEGNADYLRQFDQLILFECRDRNTETLADVIEQHFKALCRELEGKRNVLDALLLLRALFVIDGYDEVNKVSYNVVSEIIKETSSSNCRVLITTRPRRSAKEKLENLLAINNVTSTEFEIKPLTELGEQLEFLTRYEEGLGIKRGEMTESFITLKQDVKSLFTEPINLILFCDMHKHMPETISSWEKPGDVATDILRLYKKLVTIKLADVTHLECKAMLNDLFVVIGKTALEFIRENAGTFSEEELLQIQEKCIPILLNKVECSPEIILSVVLRVNRPLSGAGETTYTFHHKSIQEMFAAHFIVQRILASGDTLKSILEAKPQEMSRLREVLLYVVAALSRDSPRHLTRRWGELKEALREALGEARLAGDYVRDFVARCPDRAWTVAELAALTKDGETWHVKNGRHVASVVAMLSHNKPSRVDVDMEAAALRGAPWGALVAAVGGVEVWLKLEPLDEPHDDLLLPLHDSGHTSRPSEIIPSIIEAFQSVVSGAFRVPAHFFNSTAGTQNGPGTENDGSILRPEKASINSLNPDREML
ncbi:uncharacterized protein LOC125177879 [Hyalella azteca]|uniref:Uncharacterized protein LOC125177879 n=1 Tax=Hyalella azteca TaxID=294128 RepID=A0A979FHI2_HYAAZ|nr:uncharacterized protein LOC125177879 [Hyalella azteca]